MAYGRIQTSFVLSDLKLIQEGQHFDFLPFGSGRRGCPGVSFAAVLMELALANLLHAFDWSVAGEKMGEPEIDMEEIYGIVAHKESNLLLRASPHE